MNNSYKIILYISLGFYILFSDSLEYKDVNEDHNEAEVSIVEEEVINNINEEEPPSDPNASSNLENDDINVLELPNTVTVNSTNDSKNETESKVTCVLRVPPEGEIPHVHVVNSSRLLEHLTPVPNITTGECAMVLFFSPQCPFCGKAAPYYNALPRAFPHIPHYAIDIIAHHHLQMKYGLVAVPTIYLFHNGRAVAKFNDSSPSLMKFINFIHRLTGLNGAEGVTVISEDMTGPVPSIIVPRRDYTLYTAWTFTIFCIFLLFSRSRVCKSIVETIQTTWREAQHQHLD